MTFPSIRRLAGCALIPFTCVLGVATALPARPADIEPPSLGSIVPAPSASVTSLTQIALNFSEPVSGVTADDVIVNGTAATGVSGSGSTYTFTFPQPPYGTILVSIATNSGIADLAQPPNTFDATAPAAGWLYTILDATAPVIASTFPKPGVTISSLGQIEVTFSEDVVGVNAGDLLLNGLPATNVVAKPGAIYIFQFAASPPGAVSVNWAAAHGITDLAAPGNAFAPGTSTYQVNPSLTYGSVRISEFLAANATGLKDIAATPEDPDPIPWIELENRGNLAINLSGWSLTDDSEFPGQWVFPSKIIQPGQFLIVFASGLDIKNPSGTNRLHTNFKLSRGEGFLGLYSPDSPRSLVSGFSPKYPEQRNDRSYGFDPAGNLRYFNPPTPGAANGTSTIIGVSEPVHFSASRGHYTQPFTLALSTPTPGALIRYTTDGRDPTETVGQTYVAPIRLTNTTLLRSAAFRTNLLPSAIGTHSYLFNIAAGIRSMPIISIVTDQNNLTGSNGIVGISNVALQADGTYRPNSNGYHNPSQHGVAWEKPTSVELIRPEDNSGFQIDAGIRVQGSDYQRPRTTAASKFSYRLYFRSDYSAGRLRYPMFPLTTVEEFDQIVLRAGFNENSNPFIRDEVTRRLSHDMGDVAAHGTVLVLLVNGQLAPVSPYYNPTERVHEEMMQSHLGGGGEWDVVGPDFGQTAGAPGVIDGDRVDFANLMTNFWVNSTLRPITNDAAYVRVSKRLDLPNFADYALLNAYVAMGDWPANNWRAGRERSTNAIWRYVGWDCEWAMGIYSLAVTRDSFGFGGTGTEDAGLNSTVNSEIARTWQALVRSTEFRLLCADRIQKHFFQGGALTGANVSNRFDQLRREMIGVIPSMDPEILTWARDRLPIIMTQFNTYGLYGYSNATHGVYASSNAPVFNQHGGRVPPGFNVTMTAPIPGSAIYYTLNGADPRVMFTGSISNAAQLYTGPIALNQPVQVRTRALLDGTNWSALNEAAFDVARIGVPIRITEIHYNPSDSPAYEFIELQNLGGAPVDLSGMYFDGITYTFNTGTSLAPGARLVLASATDSAAFTARYPGVAFGFFSGGLNNSGERITLFDRSGNIITSLDYDDAGGWPTSADGGGRSLEITDANGNPDDPANWHPSSANGGTPGSINSAVLPPDVRLSEIMAENGGTVNHSGTFPDWIELHNATGSPADLTRWSLTDDANARKFVFPAGTSIPALGYLTVWCDSVTNTSPGLHTDFTLDRSGDTILLYDNVTNQIDAFSFGLQLTNFSIARVGAAWQLAQPTPNSANIATATGPASALVINEWQASAPAGQSDWIELHNPSSLPVELRGMYLSNTASVHRVTYSSYISAGGFAQLFADEAVGAAHLDFKLSAAGGTIVLYDATAAELNRVSYTNAAEGVTRGRFPDAGANIVNFPGSASPGASNYVNTYTGPVFNEIFARNQTVILNGRVADYVELLNSSGSAFPLSGMSMSVNSAEPGQFIFPLDASVPANGYLVIWSDGARPVSLTAGDLNTGQSLDGESGGAYLFNAQSQLVSAIEYGFQAIDLPIGLSGAQWRLLSAATPGAANATAAALGTNRVLRLNEWMANPSGESDWFEIFNGTNLPVELSGLTLTDDPATLGFGQFRIAPLSFIGPNGFAKCVADGNAGEGRNHVNFSLNDAGEFLGLYSNPVTTNFVLIDAVTFEAQALGVSEGRLPDGRPSVSRFPGSSTPAASNYRQLPNVVINEILAHADGNTSIFGNPQTFENAIEFSNPSASPAAIGGWHLSNGQDDFKKFRIADGTVIPAGGFVVLNESLFGNATQGGLTFSASLGGEVWLSETDPAGNLTGFRTGAKFGASEHGVSLGPVITSVGTDYSALSARTLGTANAAPKVGPIMISEIMYNPVTGAEEYVELYNASTNGFGVRIELMDYDFSQPPPRTNTWRISGGIEFVFPLVVSMGSGQRLLVVGFNPNDATALAAFRSRYSVPQSTAIFGPFSGKLDNAGESISLLKPKRIFQPTVGPTPYIRVDRVDYADAAPWPSGEVDGGGLSLQRKSGSLYGNEPLNWVASAPTPGTDNGPGIVAPPSITRSPADRSVSEGDATVIDMAADGASPLSFQWRFNGISMPDATNSSLGFSYVLMEDTGSYDCVVSNPGGSSITAAARLSVVAAPRLIIPLTSLTNRTGSNAVFSAAVRGSAPLSYQWRLNGSTLPGETNATFSRNGILIADDGDYDVLVSNPVATLLSSARLVVLSNTVITVPPTLNINAVTSSFFTVSVAAVGNPLPFNYEWRRGSIPVASNEVNSRVGFVTLQAPTNITVNQSYRVIVRNLANPGTTANFQFFVTSLADSDVDGLPDNWENAYGLNLNNPADASADADGDGISNYQEYLAGTNPTNALSRLTATIVSTGTSADVSFQALSNKTYSLQYRENLNGGSWSRLAEVFARPSNRVEVIADPATSTNRFYRIVTPRQP